MLSLTVSQRRATWFGGAAALLLTGALALHAFNPQPDPPKVFGIFGLTPADGIRLNITNVASSVGVPPGPCRATLSFVNAQGAVLKTASYTIADGNSASLALAYSEASGPLDTVSAVRTRLNVRPVVAFPPDPCFTAVSAEVTDAVTGRTNVYATPQLWTPAPVATNAGAQ